MVGIFGNLHEVTADDLFAAADDFANREAIMAEIFAEMEIAEAMANYASTDTGMAYFTSTEPGF